MCNAVSSGHLQLSSSEVNERKRKLPLRCLLVLKYALEEELDSSVPEDTGRKKKICIKPRQEVEEWINQHSH